MIYSAQDEDSYDTFYEYKMRKSGIRNFEVKILFCSAIFSPKKTLELNIALRCYLCFRLRNSRFRGLFFARNSLVGLLPAPSNIAWYIYFKWKRSEKALKILLTHNRQVFSTRVFISCLIDEVSQRKWWKLF